MTKFIVSLQNRIARKDDEGATMVEYGLLVGLIGLVAAVGAGVLGDEISAMFSDIGAKLDGLITP